jgi:hypothetical protein
MFWIKGGKFAKTVPPVKQSQVELDDLFYHVPIEHSQSFVDLARLL